MQREEDAGVEVEEQVEFESTKAPTRTLGEREYLALVIIAQHGGGKDYLTREKFARLAEPYELSEGMDTLAKFGLIRPQQNDQNRLVRGTTTITAEGRDLLRRDFRAVERAMVVRIQTEKASSEKAEKANKPTDRDQYTDSAVFFQEMLERIRAGAVAVGAVMVEAKPAPAPASLLPKDVGTVGSTGRKR